MKNTQEIISQLDAPGAGLPAVQEWTLKCVAFPVLKRVISWEKALDIFEMEGRRILAELAKVADPYLFERVLVPRMMGIEDSSRYWSLAMTLEHIICVSQGVALLMEKLSAGEPINTVVDLAAVKPRADVEAGIVGRFESFMAAFRRDLSLRVLDRGSPHCHTHPWFGCLTPHGWIVMLAIHQYIHRRQVAVIRKRLHAMSCL